MRKKTMPHILCYEAHMVRLTTLVTMVRFILSTPAFFRLLPCC